MTRNASANSLRVTMSQQPFLKDHYTKQVIPELQKNRGYRNIHQVPKLEKIVLNSGFTVSVERTHADTIANELSLIAGQKAIVTKARQSISQFKLRQGMPIGAKVTLRGSRMFDFMLRLTAISLPAIRDFQGVSHKLDGGGNYNMGIEDHTIFPEVNSDNAKANIGLDITIVTTATDDDEARELLKLMGMPFRQQKSGEHSGNN